MFPFLYSNTGAEPFTPGSLENQLFTGPWPTGTMREYYDEISYGAFGVDGYVDDWFALPQNDSCYEGSNNGLNPGTDRTDEAILAVLNGRDGVVDFSLYDNDGPDGIPNSGDDDGYVDFIAFITPESGGECGNSNIWSHKWSISGWTGSYFETNDASSAPGISNIRINSYFISAGLACGGAVQQGIGTNCHEFGHVLGIKDLYDTNGGSEGIGHWGLMGSGPWNSQDRPAHMTAWSKERLGWLNPFFVTSDIEQLCLPPVETHPVAVRLWTHGTVTPEYFMIENRQPIGFDDQLHGPGLVIYHIDEDVYDANASGNSVNADETHKAIDVECADATSAGHTSNADDLDSGANRGDSGDPWCPETQDQFTPSTVPDTRSYADSPTGVGVYNIDSCGDADGWICASYIIGTPSAGNLCMHDCNGDGCVEITNCGQWWGSPDLWIDNDDDGAHDLPVEGLENHLWFRVENTGTTVLGNVNVNLYYSDPALGQLWPSSGNLIGTAVIPSMAPGDVIKDYVPFVYPQSPEFVDHYCIGAVAVHGADPQNSEYPPNDNNVAQVNHQVLVARAGGKLLAGECGAYQKRSKIDLYCGPSGDFTIARIVLGSPPNFDDVVIPDGWVFDYDDGEFVLVCEQGQPGTSTWVTMTAPETNHGDVAYIPLTLWDEAQEEAIGGTVLEYRIDCVEPGEIPDPEGRCLLRAPDDQEGPTVELTWSKVQFDAEGGPEQILYYAVHRSDNQGNPEVLVDEVAVDADPDQSGIQWYDHVLMDEGFVYTYRIQPFDGTGNPGPFSAPILVDCSASSVAAGHGNGIRMTSVTPNPFTRSTTLSFRVADGGSVDLEIYTVQGQLVRSLARTRPYAAGAWSLEWDGRSDRGSDVPAGVYMYRLAAQGQVMTGRVTLVR